jgi:hypothetical protein
MAVQYTRPDGAVVRVAATPVLSIEGQKGAVHTLRGLDRFAKAVQTQGLRVLAKVVRGQTLKRIEQTKTSPDGERWRPWSPAYALTRKRKHSLLIDTRALLRTLAMRSAGGEVFFGSPQPYARHVQRERPFLGFGRNNFVELQGTLDGWAKQEMQRRGYA